MSRSNPLPAPRGLGAVPVGTAALAFLLTAGVVAGCDCSPPRVRGSGAKIEVDPVELTIEGVPGRVTETALKVFNRGNGVLRLEKPAEFIGDGDNGPVRFFATQLVTDCENNPRPESVHAELAAGGCAIMAVRYRPEADGTHPSTLRLFSNDADQPELDVPINASAATPDIEICAFDGNTEIGCSAGGQLELDFGIVSVSPPERVTYTLEIRSKGSRALDIASATFEGEADFKVVESLDRYPSTLAPHSKDVLTVEFEPRAGGRRDAELVFESNDPLEERVVVTLVALGDGPGLCVGICLADSTGCRSLPVADFGRVTFGSVGHRVMMLASCGTKPFRLTGLDLVSGAPEFAYDWTAPSGGLEMPPNDRVAVPLTFAPVEERDYSGKLEILTDIPGPSGAVALQGSGIDSGCSLELATAVVDFGTVAQGFPGRRDVTVSNLGDEDCYLGTTSITAGANVKFELSGTPANDVLPPGQMARFEVMYTPADMTQPDLGELTIPYGAEPGQYVKELKAQLKGTPTDQPVCRLEAAPAATGGGGIFGGGGTRSLKFGAVRINTEKVLPVSFKNVGSASCTIKTAAIASSNPIGGVALGFDPKKIYSIKSPFTNVTVSAGATVKLDIGFKPEKDMDYAGPMGSAPIPGFPGGSAFGIALQVSTTDTAGLPGTECGAGGFGGGGGVPGCVAWELSGQGTKADLVVLPGEVDFGLVTLGCQSREMNLAVYNVGQAEIKVDSIEVDPPSAAGQFVVVAPPTPFPLPGGQQKALKIRFKPSAVGVQTASIKIRSDATNVPAPPNNFTVVPLKGTGTTDSHQVDTYDGSTQPKTDVLFVVDDSGSMSEEQALLGDNAKRFLDVAKQLNSDFHVGVVTTDVEKDPGVFRGNPKVVDATMSDAADKVRSTVRGLGTNGSADERGLESMFLALTSPNITGPNAGFLRSDARLSVVVISDEEDHSKGTVDFYVDFLKNIKGIHNASMVSLSAVVGDSGRGCSSSNGDAEAGERYIAVQQRTGGKFKSICASDWGQVAQDIGLDAFATRSGYPLSRVADPAQVTVFVNGQPKTVGTDWTFDAESNSVVFKPSATPAPGATVVIDYTAMCFP